MRYLIKIYVETEVDPSDLPDLAFEFGQEYGTGEGEDKIWVDDDPTVVEFVEKEDE